MPVEIACPVCGSQLQDVISFPLRSLSVEGRPERVETIDAGRCEQCSVRFQRRRGETLFWWYPACRECNAEMTVAGPGDQSPSILYRCVHHPAETWTYRPGMSSALR
jgi:hypothetical protein